MKTNTKPKLHYIGPKKAVLYPSYIVDIQGTYKSGMTMYKPSIICPRYSFTYIGKNSYFDKLNAKEEAQLDIDYYEATGSWDLDSWDIN